MSTRPPHQEASRPQPDRRLGGQRPSESFLPRGGIAQKWRICRLQEIGRVAAAVRGCLCRLCALETAIAPQASSSAIAALEREVRGALAFMMRFQYLPGPT